MGEVSTIGLDLAKSVFQAHGADEIGKVMFRKKLRRDQVLEFFASQPKCLVAMEACASAHFWARELASIGHTTKLIAPNYVKPFVKRQKNDMADAEAICEAAQRPTMRLITPKSAEAQAAATVFRARDLLVRQRTQLINALRGHLAEYGMVLRKGADKAAALIELVSTPTLDVPEQARSILEVLAQTLEIMQAKIATLDAEIAKRARADGVAKRLMSIPGVGAVIATALVALAPEPETFKRGRDFAAWIGLTPLQHSSGGKERLGRITKMGERSLRRLLIIGASSAAKAAAAKGAADTWLGRMLSRKPRMLVVVALANKMARVAWALMRTEEPTELWPKRHDARQGLRLSGCRRRSEERFGATVGETGPGKPVNVQAHHSARKRIGPGPRIPYRPAACERPHQQAGHTEAPRLHAPPIQRFLLHLEGRPHTDVPSG